MSLICSNIDSIRTRIQSACVKSGRLSEDITLVGVTKTRSLSEIKEAIDCGIRDIGENYVQESIVKFDNEDVQAKKHLIGHLQTNKVKQAIEIFDIIESVDSEKLAIEIGRRAEEKNKQIDILLEVKVSTELTKFGASEYEVLGLAEKVSEIKGIRLCGLMGMAPFFADPEHAKPYFNRIKVLWDKLPNEQRLYLSMGMTQDFEVAIEEGSNMVRIGTAIFGSRV